MSSQPWSTSPAAAVASPKGFRSLDLVSIRDLNPREVEAVLELAALMKARPGDFRAALAGRQLVMFFEKPSLRTRLTFESAMASLGGVPFFVDQTRSLLDAREELSDIAHNLERWVDILVLRTFAHLTVERMAEYASIPVVNALSDREHPCQALADYFTLQERLGEVKNLELAYLGDGNNVANSLLLTCAALGSSIRISTPEGYGPDPEVLADAQEIAQQTGASIRLLSDPQAAVRGVDAVYTDTWVSMGQESEREERTRVLQPFQVNEDLMAKARPDTLFMHCLPAYRGKEVTGTVIDSSRSLVFEQAENRLHMQKAILLLLLGHARFPVRRAHA